MPRTMVINVAGLGRDLVAEVPSLAALGRRGMACDLEPVLPAVTCAVQATLVTGEPPARHGIVGNGLYFFDTAEVRFWEQSAHLVDAPRVWDLARRGGRPRVALLFWQLGMYGTADVLLTPKPVHGPGGALVQDCYSRPADLYGRLAAEESALAPGGPRGPFNLMDYWGPRAGVGASRWIADASLAVWRDERPDLLLTYLPHLDYTGHRAGPGSDAHREAARQLEPLVAPLIAAAEDDGARVIVLSEYSFVPVCRAVAINRVLREAGLVAVRTVDGAEYAHPGDSRAFAVVDNQVAHVYFPATRDLAADVRKVRRLLEGVDGVAEVLDRPALAARGLDHPRSGDLVALAAPDAHFVYYWWLDDAAAPPFARTVDIHAKPGFDAAELLFDPLAQSIPLSADAIRGSHGLVPDDGRGWGVFIAGFVPKGLAGRKALRAAEVARLLV
ncbi:MAG: alkaline phosphatase family protein [Planctomycetes bacterium]|nr:alkaline phosphatase family protein [Planctomycetota bacterium]